MNQTAIVRDYFLYRDLGIVPPADPSEVMPCHPPRN